MLLTFTQIPLFEQLHPLVYLKYDLLTKYMTTSILACQSNLPEHGKEIILFKLHVSA